MATLRLFRRSPSLSPPQREVVRGRVWARYDLAEPDRHRHAELTADLLERFDWEAARGFSLSDDMPVVVAGLAALLVLHVTEDDPYRQVSAVVLHPAGMPLHGPQPGPSQGVVVGGPRHVDGHTAMRNPVHLSWRAIDREARGGSGRNLVLHEFAHQLDLLDGVLDGTPPIADHAARQRWVEVCTEVYDMLGRGGGPSPLRRYATTNPAEFFAVATEAFFERPHGLGAAHRALYAVLRTYFGQDPDTRQSVGDVSNASSIARRGDHPKP